MATFKNYRLLPGAVNKILRAKRNGIRIPTVAFVAARRAGIPYWMACAFLIQESGGGQNIFGHDPTIFAGAGKVTKKKYLAYRAERRRTGKMQGVGPMQLTWFSFQDDADRLGGTWRTYYNCLVGFRILAGYLNQGMTPWEAAKRYNGSGPAAEAYADTMVGRFEDWKNIILD